MEFLIWYAGLLVLIILCWIINRHIIGWVGYNFFPPIVVWYAIHIFGMTYGRTTIIIMSTILWWIITKLITNYTNLSLYPRYGLYMIISLWIFMSTGTIYTEYFVDWLSIEQSHHMMYLFVLVASMSVRTYASWRWVNSLLRWWHIIRFFIMSFVIYSILSREFAYRYFMDHGIVVMLLSLCTLLIWSYTWLQVKEMIRFRKLIWNKITNKKKRG